MNDLRRVMDTRVPVASPDVGEAAKKLGFTVRTCSALPPNTLLMVDAERCAWTFRHDDGGGIACLTSSCGRVIPIGTDVTRPCWCGKPIEIASES